MKPRSAGSLYVKLRFMSFRFHFALQLAACLTCFVFIRFACATEVYKWTDANGQVHFGDGLSAPSNGKKIDIKVQAANESAPEQRDVSKPTQPRTSVPLPPSQVSKGKSKPADPSRIKAGCQDLIDQISKVKPGTNWQSLFQKFDANCPGIAYECNTYRTHPENNKCSWVERNGNNVLHTNNYE